MQDLTLKQKATLLYIRSYILTNGYPPSIRDMVRDFSLKSPSPVQSRLEQLRDKGYIDWKDNESRTIHLLKERLTFVDFEPPLEN